MKVQRARLWLAACELYLLDEVHTLGWLNPIGIVHNVWNVILCAHSCQLFQPRRGQGHKTRYRQNLQRQVATEDTLPTCQGPAGQSRKSWSEHRGCSRLPVPGSSAPLRPGWSAALRPPGRSPPPPVQNLGWDQRLWVGLSQFTIFFYGARTIFLILISFKAQLSNLNILLSWSFHSQKCTLLNSDSLVSLFLAFWQGQAQ